MFPSPLLTRSCALKKSLPRTWKIHSIYEGRARLLTTIYSIRLASPIVYHSRSPIRLRRRLFFQPIFIPSALFRYATDAYSCEHPVEWRLRELMDLRHSTSRNRIKENDVKKRTHSSCTKKRSIRKKEGGKYNFVIFC